MITADVPETKAPLMKYGPKMEKYLTDFHFEKMGRVLALVSIVYLYFNLNEYMVPGYKLKALDTVHLKELFTGEYAPLFWSVQMLGLVIPTILMLIKKMRRPMPMLIISLFVLAGAWFKRYIIVVPSQAHPFLPVQNFPEKWMVYTPTLIETAVTLASIVMALMIITILSKLFPVLPIQELAEEEAESASGLETNNQQN